MFVAMTYAVPYPPIAIASPLATAPIATSYSSVSKISSPLAVGSHLGYGGGIVSPALAATPIAYRASAVPIVSSIGYGASIAAPLAIKTPISTSYGYGIGSPVLAGGYLG